MIDKPSSKPPISLELGAKASLEIKTVIPEESTGRLIDALTDIIRPFTESRGLRADQIRLQREEVALEIARRAAARLKMEGSSRAVPNKILVPLLEKASLEEISDDFMVDRWANLLASSSSEQNVQPRFVSILAEMTTPQAVLLELVKSNSPRGRPPDYYTRQLAEDSFASEIKSISGAREVTHAALIKFAKERDGLCYVFYEDDIPNTEAFSLEGFEDGENLLQLESLGLVWVFASWILAHYQENRFKKHFYVRSFLSPLGSAFVEACSPSDS